MSAPKKRVLIVQPSLQPPGGGNGVAAWMIQALKDHHRLAVLTWDPFVPEEVDRYFGTSIAGSDVAVLRPPAWLRLLRRLRPTSMDLLRSSMMQRLARSVGSAYDVLLSVNNEIDFGKRGIQYVHYPSYLRPRPPEDMRWFHVAPALWAYYAVCDRLARFSVDRMRANLTLVNSEWTGGRFRERYGSEPLTLYPPVLGVARDTPWPERESAFLCIGRLSPEKELEKVVAILRDVRARLPGVRLRLVGNQGRSAYHRRVRRLVRENADWVSLHLDLPREELSRMIASHRYGIHGMRDEHFGIAVAEMVSGGCIVFVPDGGGQVEVVGREPSLLYGSTTEATDRIARVLADPEEQARLRAHLGARRALFSTERFVSRIRAIVDEFGDGRGADPRPGSARAEPT